MPNALAPMPRCGVRWHGKKYQPYCTYCEWSGPILSNPDNAYDLLTRHVNKRIHKTNSSSPTRFVV